MSTKATLSTEPVADVDRRPLERRHFLFTALAFLALSFIQSPGRIGADTKYDLTENPLGFLGRAAHLWSSQAPLGQVQNQAYGYFFPHGAFFSSGDILSIPPWITQRLWWAILLVAGFWGVIRLAEELDIGSRGSRVVAGIAFALSPRILATLGPISSESLPMMLAPWVLLPLVRLWNGHSSPRTAAAHSAVAVALMGSVNAVATAAACVPAGIWWALTKPDRTWLRFTGWWVLCLAFASLWWLIPLLMLGRLSPPFLDFIESAGVTTQWNSLVEVLRGTDNWTSFVSPDRIAGSVLITQPDTILATGAIAAAGLAGLTMRSMPARGRLVVILMTGVVVLTCGYLGALGSPIAEPVLHFLDTAGAPLRNVHKFDPLVRLPLVLGLAHLLGRASLPLAVPWRRLASEFSHIERNRPLAGAALLMVALTIATAVAWTGRLAPRGTYEEVPQYWHDTADWLATNAPDTRALVVPGAPFGSQRWGLTRDEPLQALARSPWAVRDAIPLNPPGAIRALDAVQRLFADGQPSPTLAAALRSQGFGFLVVRNDLDADTSNSTRPLLVHNALDGSPGVRKVAEFGDRPNTLLQRSVVYDTDLLPPYRPIEIYAVEPESDDLNPSAPYTVDLDGLPIVAGGPEALARGGIPTAILYPDAVRARLPVDRVIVTDTPRDREIDYGRVDNHASAIRAPDDPRRTLNIATDYLDEGAAVISARWSGARVTVSSSAADATQLGGVSPSSSAAHAFDGDPGTSWISESNQGALGEWLQLDLENPISSGLLQLVVSPAASGAPVDRIEVTTDIGSTGVRVPMIGEPFNVALPPGRTTWIRITALATATGSVGNQFGLSEVTLRDFTNPDEPAVVPIEQQIVVPSRGSMVLGWDLAQEFPGRAACFGGPDRVRCSPALLLAPEEEHFSRVLEVPGRVQVTPSLTVRSRPSASLEELVTPAELTAVGLADVADIRGSAFAAADGDVRTTWTARDATGARPTLTILLPEPTLVTGVRLTRSPGPLPAAPRRVSINLGGGPQTRTIPSSSTATISVHPQVTDRIEITLTAWPVTLDRTPAGFTVAQAPGLAEVALIGEDSQVIAAQPQPADRVFEIPCGEGPVITIGDTTIDTRVRATVDQLKSNAVLSAEPCDASSVDLEAGSVKVNVEAGDLFVTDRLTLDTGSDAINPVHRPVKATEWTQSRRIVQIEPSDRDTVLVIPESTNVGWTAVSDGKNLQALTVNGWQQGWIVPAGTTQLTLEFGLDRWYRAAIFGGLLLLIPLFALAFVRGTSRRTPPLRPVQLTWVAAGAFVAACSIVGGVTGAVFAGAALFAVPWLRARWRWSVPVLTATTFGFAVALLSRSPWQSFTGYLGHSVMLQLPALLALVLVGAAAVAGPAWFFSQRLAANRNGSSTSE